MGVEIGKSVLHMALEAFVRNSSVTTTIMERHWEILSDQLPFVFPEVNTIISSNHKSKEGYLEDVCGLPVRLMELGRSWSDMRSDGKISTL